MAIDKRARAEVSIAATDYQTVRTSGYIDGRWKFSANQDGIFEWIGDGPPEGGLDLLHEVWAGMGISGNFDISLDTAEFLDPVSGSKLGLGSSAALTVALVTAFSNVTVRAGVDARNAAEAHRRLQHGQGSGVDIAASLAGGVIEYRMQDEAFGRPMTWPVGLEYALLWSGLPTSTSEQLQKLDEARRSMGSPASITRLCEAAEATASCWANGGTTDLLAEFHRYVNALMQFDVDHDLGIFDAGHKELAEAAAKRKVVYKPCGAGGGDSGVVFATDREAVAEFANFAGHCGYRLLDVSLEASGAILEN
jgi:phosphomevalonate kinase